MQLLKRNMCGSGLIEEHRNCVVRHELDVQRHPDSEKAKRDLRREQAKLARLILCSSILDRYPGLAGMADETAIEFDRTAPPKDKAQLYDSIGLWQRGGSRLGQPLPLYRVTTEMMREELARIRGGGKLLPQKKPFKKSNYADDIFNATELEFKCLPGAVGLRKETLERIIEKLKATSEN